MAFLGSSSRTPEQQQEARDARRMLKQRVRNDWYYPPLPQYRQQQSRTAAREDSSSEDDEAKVAGFRFHTPAAAQASTGVAEASEISGWRERTCSTDSDSGAESAVASRSAGSSKSKKSEFRFEGPDSVGAQVQERRTAKKRKRRELLAEEMSWNEGLEHWVRQRDVWSGARQSSETTQDSATPLDSSREGRAMGLTSAALPYRSLAVKSAESTPRTSTSSADASVEGEMVSSAATTPDPHQPSSLPREGGLLPPASSDLVPIMHPILPTHPIRRKIGPSMYPEIYSKIIVSGRTPSVPLNLKNLVEALVEGWKADGEWPPKGSAPEASIGKKKGRGSMGADGLRAGVKAVVKSLRITGGSSEVGGRGEG